MKTSSNRLIIFLFIISKTSNFFRWILFGSNFVFIVFLFKVLVFNTLGQSTSEEENLTSDTLFQSTEIFITEGIKVFFLKKIKKKALNYFIKFINRIKIKNKSH